LSYLILLYRMEYQAVYSDRLETTSSCSSGTHIGER
jgi:hypothetical protein